MSVGVFAISTLETKMKDFTMGGFLLHRSRAKMKQKSRPGKAPSEQVLKDMRVNS